MFPAFALLLGVQRFGGLRSEGHISSGKSFQRAHFWEYHLRLFNLENYNFKITICCGKMIVRALYCFNVFSLANATQA